MTEEICSKCGSDLADFTEDPCIECAYQHDPHEPNYNEELNFDEDGYVNDVHELSDFADVYNRVYKDYDREDE